jgi:hypothetical protein
MGPCVRRDDSLKLNMTIVCVNHCVLNIPSRLYRPLSRLRGRIGVGAATSEAWPRSLIVSSPRAGAWPG